MNAGPYDKAVEGFEAFIEASAKAVYAKPVRLIEQSGHHMTTGYRHTAMLEAEGFLRRDESGVFLQGAAALRTALSGFGFGRLAPVIPLVLRRLREETQHTAFLALQSGVDVSMGPYSIGRASHHVSLEPCYRHETPRDFTDDQPIEAGLAPRSGEVQNRLQTLLLRKTAFKASRPQTWPRHL
ncbi:MAG: hypothetical protein OXC60_06700, partial [Litoreibacter sp.]|nr:hypothetical protein [Litoreibacter sp.]